MFCSISSNVLFFQMIVNNIAAYAKEKYRLDILGNVKASLRLTKQCEKVGTLKRVVWYFEEGCVVL